jgi:translocation and assembly module TamB
LTLSQPKARLRIVWKVLLGVLAFFVLAIGGLTWYVSTASFHERVHRRVVSTLEQMTGGKVELGRFTVVPFRFRIEAYDLTIHGRESPSEIPYAHVDRLVAEVRIVSVLERQYGFSSLFLDHPVIHIIVYPDGSTNQPSPAVARPSGKTPIAEFFSLSVNRLQVSRGELLWNDQRVPLDFAANDVSVQLQYAFFTRRYQGHVRLTKLDSKFPEWRPFSSFLETQFGLERNSLEVKALRWTSGRSHADLSGQLSNFRDPKFTGTYNVQLDLAEAGSILRQRELRSGRLELGGSGEYSLKDFQASGKVLLKNLEWHDGGVAVRNAALTSKFDLNPSSLKLSELEARLLGGTATGDLQVENWLPTSGPAGKRGSNAEKGSLRLRLKDFSVANLAAALSTRRTPLDRLRLSGSAGGTLQARWTGSRQNADASFSLEVTPPKSVLANQVPLTANAAGTYHGVRDEMEISDLNLATRATQLHAAGVLSSTAAVRFSAATTDLTELQPLLTAFHGPELPLQLNGRATFNGTARGWVSDLTLAGHLQVNDFESILPASDNLRPGKVHWDSFAADVQLSRHQLAARNAVLKHGDTMAAFDISAMLRAGAFVDDSPFTARVVIHKAEVAEIQSLTRYQYPVGGTVDLTLNATGTRKDPHGDGRLRLTNGSIYGQPVSRLTSDLRLSDGELQLNNILLAYRDAQVTGAASYRPDTRGFRLKLTGSGLELAHVPELQKSRMDIAGQVDFTAEGSGTWDTPIINAKLQIRDLAFDQEHVGNFTLNAVTHGSELQLVGRSQFEKAQLDVDGIVHVRGDWPADLALRFDHLDVDALLRIYLQNYATEHSAAAGGLRVTGPLRRPRELAVHGDLSYLSLNVEKISAQNDGPVRFSMANQVVKLEQLHLVGENTDITAQGTVQLAGDRELDLLANGRVNLKLLEGFSPEITSSGTVTVAVAVTGTYANPVLSGKIEVVDSAIASSNLPNGLSDINGELVFNQDRLQIQSLSARVGGGTVNLSGYMAYKPRLNFNVTAHASDVRLRPGGISAMADADLHLAGSKADAALTGDMTVTKFNLTPGFDFARYLQAPKQTTSPQVNSLLDKVRMDVHVVTTPELQMQSSLAKLSGEADLHLRGTPVNPTVLGRVDTNQGDVYFNGTKYSLERGSVTFLGPSGIKPVLDLQATTRVRDYDITLGVSGTPDKLSFTYRSEPPLPPSDVVALLALGRTQSESATLASSSQGAFSQEASNVILSQALNATLSNRAQRLFGISRIKIDPQGLNTETSPTRQGPAVTIEQQVSNNITLTYSTEVAQTSQQIIQAEYNITRNISIRAVRDQNGVVSFDVRLRQRRK